MATEHLLDAVRTAGVARGLHPRTRAAYVRWVTRYLHFHGVCHHAGLGAPALQRYLTHLVEEAGVAPATQRQARSALQFLYRVVPGGAAVTPMRLASWRPAPALPVDVVHAVLAQLSPEARVMAALVYGAGLRVGECCRLRIRDVELERGVLRVRRPDGSGARLTLIPASLREALAAQVDASRRLQQRGVARGGGLVPLSVARPGEAAALRHWRWMWVFPSRRAGWSRLLPGHALQPRHPSSLQRALATAARAAGVSRAVGPVTCQRLRHTFAAQLLAAGYPIGAVQALLGHRDRRTTLRYHDALPVGWLGVRSPLDFGMPVALPEVFTGGVSGGGTGG